MIYLLRDGGELSPSDDMHAAGFEFTKLGGAPVQCTPIYAPPELIVD